MSYDRQQGGERVKGLEGSDAGSVYAEIAQVERPPRLYIGCDTEQQALLVCADSDRGIQEVVGPLHIEQGPMAANQLILAQ